jgi:hypothetical protein
MDDQWLSGAVVRAYTKEIMFQNNERVNALDETKTALTGPAGAYETRLAPSSTSLCNVPVALWYEVGEYFRIIMLALETDFPAFPFAGRCSLQASAHAALSPTTCHSHVVTGSSRKIDAHSRV